MSTLKLKTQKLELKASQQTCLLLFWQYNNSEPVLSEAAPLKGYSKENLLEIQTFLAKHLDSVVNFFSQALKRKLRLNRFSDYLLAAVFNSAKVHLLRDLPSLFFAFESAYHSLLRQNFSSQLSEGERLETFSITSNGFVSLDHHLDLESIYQQIKERKKVKIKISSNKVSFFLKLLKELSQLAEHLKSKKTNQQIDFSLEKCLRIDCNRRFDKNEIDELSQVLQDYRYFLEYIEEPLPLSNSWENFRKNYRRWYERYKIPWAIDESCHDLFYPLLKNDAPIETHCKKISQFFSELIGLKACILKPSLRFGWTFSLKLVELIKQLDFYPIVTTGMESPIGLLSNCFIYQQVSHILGRKITPGLDAQDPRLFEFIRPKALKWMNYSFKTNFLSKPYFVTGDLK